MKLPITPFQRWCLYRLCYDDAQRYKGQEARRFRRFCRHLGIDAIASAALRWDALNTAQVKIETPRLFEVDAEDLTRLSEIDDKTERTGLQNDLLGPLFDMAAELKAERPIEWLDAPMYDPTAEDWRPKEATVPDAK